MINKIIRNYVAKMVAGRSDDGIMITLRDPQKVEFQTAMMQELLMRRGIDPNAIQSEAQLKMIINQIKAMEKAEDAAQSGIRNTQSAKIFNRMGEELDPNQPIIGGTQPGKKIDQDTFRRLAETNTQRIKQKISDKKRIPGGIDLDQPPPGSRGGDEDIAAPVQSSEETLKNMMEAENKKAIDNLKQKMAKEKSRTQRISGNLRADNSQRVEIGRPKLDEDEYDYYREILGEDPEVDYYPVKGDETRELLEAMVKEQEDEVAYMKRLYDKGALDDPEKKSTGGRVGLKFGSGKRFLEKVFGAEKFAEMKTRDPEMYVGLLEIVDMYRKRDKEGLKMYLQKFLPHMDDAQIEDFIRGSDGTEGLIGELIRLGSGRDYAGKIEMMKKANEIRKLDNLEITDDMKRKPNADGGRIGYKLGTGIEAAIAENKKLQSLIDAELAMQKQIEKFLENRMIRSSPFGILMDREPPNISDDEFKPPSTLDKSGKDAKIEKLPFKPDQSNIVIFDDGTVYYKDTGEFYDENLGKVTSPSPGAKPVRETKEAKDGGIMRLGLKEGSGMSRRTFLKFLGGAMSIPIIGKILKPFKVGKTVTKVPIIKTDNVPGKPEWFDQLVNKVILEGDDVSKRFATKDREIVHMKVLDEGTGGKEFPPGTPGSDDISIMVTQDLDAGAVRVEYRNPENVYGDPVQLQYKKPLPDEGDPRPGAEFDTAESGPVGRAFGPDDYEIEIDEIGGTSISDLTSDVSKLKEYATGQKQTLKEFVQSKKRKDKAARISEGGEDEMQAVIDRQGEFVQFDDLDPGDYASGGIARMLGE